MDASIARIYRVSLTNDARITGCSTVKLRPSPLASMTIVYLGAVFIWMTFASCNVTSTVNASII